MKTLEDLQEEIGIWGDVTFPGTPPEKIADKLIEEALEFYGVPSRNLETLLVTIKPFADKAGSDNWYADEAADVTILLLRYAHTCGFNLEEAVEKKMQVNRNPDWQERANRRVRYGLIPDEDRRLY